MPPYRSLAERFWEKVDVRGPDDCWEWKAAQTKDGYGSIGVGNQKTDKAHRVSWQLHNGPIPEGLHVLHNCDNPSCVNPKHLHLGTNADNVREKVERGRHPCLSFPGERNGNAKLTVDQVIEIRRQYADCGTSQVDLAEIFGVTYQLIWRIVHRKCWKHVED